MNYNPRCHGYTQPYFCLVAKVNRLISYLWYFFTNVLQMLYKRFVFAWNDSSRRLHQVMMTSPQLLEKNRPVPLYFIKINCQVWNRVPLKLKNFPVPCFEWCHLSFVSHTLYIHFGPSKSDQAMSSFSILSSGYQILSYAYAILYSTVTRRSKLVSSKNCQGLPEQRSKSTIRDMYHISVFTPQQTRDIEPLLVKCWASVADGGPS